VPVLRREQGVGKYWRLELAGQEAKGDARLIVVPVLTDTLPIEAKIKDILKRGKVVCFTNIINGIVKYVDTWNMDETGDLTAFYSSGATKFVCPFSVEYEITEKERTDCAIS